MFNLFSGKSKNKLKGFILICGCFIALTTYAVQSPPNLENTGINEFSLIQTNQAADLAKAKNCMACHSVNNKVIGPAFKDVGAKYVKDKTALDKLTAKVMKGGSGVWGVQVMPANTQVTKAEAATLIKWILTLK